MEKNKKRSYILYITFVITLLMNFLTATGLLNGNSQKVISDRYDTLITPAPPAFSIWTIIYVLVLAVIVIGHVTKDGVIHDKMKTIFPFFFGSLILNIFWNIAFTANQIGLSAILITLYAVFLGIIVTFLRKMETHTSFLSLSFGIHFGWILVATVVNWALFYVKQGWDFALTSGVFASVVLIIVTGLAYLFVSKSLNPFLLLSMAWAFYFIYIKNQIGIQNFNNGLVGLVAFGLAIVAIGGFVYYLIKVIKNPY